MRKHTRWYTPMMLAMPADGPGDRSGRGRSRDRGRGRSDFFGPEGPFGPGGPFGADGPFGTDGPFGARGPFGGRHAGHRYARGRARRGNVRVAILHALAENEMNGYQIIGFIEDKTDGAWRPSPGAVYPALAQLEDEGLIAQIDLDGQKAFQLTEAGRQTVAEQADNPKPWEFAQERRHCGPAMTDLWDQFKQLAMALQAATRTGDEDIQTRAADFVRRARREVYKLLAEAGDDED